MKRRSLAGLEAVSRAAKFQTSIKDFFCFNSQQEQAKYRVGNKGARKCPKYSSENLELHHKLLIQLGDICCLNKNHQTLFINGIMSISKE